MTDTPKQPLSLPDALTAYQAGYLAARNLAPRTRISYTGDLTDLLRFLTEKRQLTTVADVKREHLEAYLSDLDRRGLLGTSRARKVASIKSFFSFLEQQGSVRFSPAQKLAPPERESP